MLIRYEANFKKESEYLADIRSQKKWWPRNAQTDFSNRPLPEEPSGERKLYRSRNLEQRRFVSAERLGAFYGITNFQVRARVQAQESVVDVESVKELKTEDFNNWLKPFHEESLHWLDDRDEKLDFQLKDKDGLKCLKSCPKVRNNILELLSGPFQARSNKENHLLTSLSLSALQITCLMISFPYLKSYPTLTDRIVEDTLHTKPFI